VSPRVSHTIATLISLFACRQSLFGKFAMLEAVSRWQGLRGGIMMIAVVSCCRVLFNWVERSRIVTTLIGFLPSEGPPPNPRPRPSPLLAFICPRVFMLEFLQSAFPKPSFGCLSASVFLPRRTSAPSSPRILTTSLVPFSRPTCPSSSSGV
jgi:hypothetical protein